MDNEAGVAPVRRVMLIRCFEPKPGYQPVTRAFLAAMSLVKFGSLGKSRLFSSAIASLGFESGHGDPWASVTAA